MFYSTMVIIIIMPMMQVPLGVIFKNDNKLDEMVDIMDHLNQYVPTEVTHTTVQIPGRAPKRMQIDTMHKVLIGGDQLTVARMKGAKSMREDSQHDAGRLDGFIPVVEDWHTKVCLLEVRLFHVAMMILSVSSTPCMLPLILFLLFPIQVMWIRLYQKDAFQDFGTLQQLQSLINRSNVPVKPKNNVNAAEDFIQVNVKIHLICN